MDKKYSQNYTQFTSHQIVCIEAQKAFLYSEVIQVIVSRQSCWARPLLLVPVEDGVRSWFDRETSREQIIDLREGSDILLPIDLFRPALDTEIIPLISQLDNLDPSLTEKRSTGKHLNNFIKQVWQEKFKQN